MKTKLIAFAIALTVITVVQVNAQSETHKSTVTLNMGCSLIGNILNEDYPHKDYDFESSSIPLIQATYDFAIVDWFSVGVAASCQIAEGKYNDYGVNNENFKTTFYRSNFAVRGLFHYGKSEMFDMYSGVRFGYTNWSYKTDYVGDDYDGEQDGHMISAAQLVLFGIRGYFFKNYGANIEFAVGSPYFMSVGFNYRF